MPAATDSSVDTAALARALQDDDVAQRAARATDALAWRAEGSGVEWLNGIGYLGSLSLNGYPTLASIYSPVEESDPGRTDWERAWLGGKRWCLTLRKTGLKWFDLQTGNNWSCSIAQIDSRTLEGFTPSSFVQLGRFEPRVDSKAIGHSEAQENPTEFLLQKLYGWWNDFLNDYGSPRDLNEAKSTFTKIVSAILLIRTIEDIGASPFLPPRTLEQACLSLKNGDRDPIRSIFDTVASKFASRILRDIPGEYYPDRPLMKMIDDTYSMGVNFAHLDVDPVGQFYEQVLGVSYERVDSRQPGLFDRGAAIRRDESARRLQGVYYTPRTYADTLARVTVRPLVRAAENLDEIPVICDIAAGSGELLCAALRQVLEVPEWRKPENAKKIMDGRLIAVDLNPAAVHLTALNLLRTAIRRVPELIADHLPLPSLERNLISGNALANHIRSALPKADVTLLNPPFHGTRKWTPGLPLSDQPRWLRDQATRPNQAFAMLLAALSVTKPGGRVGAVFPSTLVTGDQAAEWRGAVSRQIDIEAIVENYANAFEGVQSYAGLLWGRRRQPSGATRTPVRHVRIEGAMKFQSVDFGALLARDGIASPHVSDSVAKAIGPSDDVWTETSRGPDIHVRRNGRIKIADLILDGAIHQAPVVAPKPWGRNLFLFDETKENRLEHRISGFETRSDSSALRRIAWPNYMMSIPILCDPVVNGVRVFLPGDGSEPVDIRELRYRDPVAFEAASAIRMAVGTGDATDVPPSGRGFVDLIRKEKIGFHTPKGYRDRSEPLVIASRATRSEAGQRKGIYWSTWVALDGSVVPVGGLWFRTASVELSTLLAAWMNSSEMVNHVIKRAPARNMGTSEPTFGEFLKIEVPDPTRDSATERLAELLEALRDYRRAAINAADPLNAAKLDEYAVLRDLARSLWRGT